MPLCGCPDHEQPFKHGASWVPQAVTVRTGLLMEDLEAQPWKLATQYQSHFSSIARQAKSNLDGRTHSDRFTIGPRHDRFPPPANGG